MQDIALLLSLGRVHELLPQQCTEKCIYWRSFQAFNNYCSVMIKMCFHSASFLLSVGVWFCWVPTILHVHCMVQEGRTSPLTTSWLTPVLLVTWFVCSVCFYFDPAFIRVPGSSSCKVDQGSTLFIEFTQTGHCWRQQWAHTSAVPLCIGAPFIGNEWRSGRGWTGHVQSLVWGEINSVG